MEQTSTKAMVIFGVICIAVMMVLLLLGESTLPLFGGDEELAARVYKTVFMGLMFGTVAGMSVLGMAILADFSRAQMARVEKTIGETPPPFRVALWLFENARPVVFFLFIFAGIGLTAAMWITEGAFLEPP